MTHIVLVPRPDIHQTGGDLSQLPRIQIGSWRTSLSVMGYHPCTPCALADDQAFFCHITRHCMQWTGRCSASYAGFLSVSAFYIALFPVSIKKTTIITVS